MVFPGILGFSTIGFFVYRERKSSGWNEQYLTISHPHKTPTFNISVLFIDFEPTEHDPNEPTNNFYQLTYLEASALRSPCKKTPSVLRLTIGIKRFHYEIFIFARVISEYRMAMSPDVFMPRKDFTITNQLGIHARPAAQFVKIANSFPCDIRVEKDDDEVDGKSILGLMMLAAGHGSVISIITEGDQEAEALTALGGLIERDFEENATA
jgi:phosphocarrier protein